MAKMQTKKLLVVEDGNLVQQLVFDLTAMLFYYLKIFYCEGFKFDAWRLFKTKFKACLYQHIV